MVVVKDIEFNDDAVLRLIELIENSPRRRDDQVVMSDGEWAVIRDRLKEALAK